MTMPGMVRHRYPHARALTISRRASGDAVLCETLAVTLAMLAILALGCISPEVLTALKIKYASAGGIFLEKVHPATYLATAAFGLLLLRGGNPVAGVAHALADAKALIFYFCACVVLAGQAVLLERPVTSVIDTFLLPLLLCLIVWDLTPAQRKPLVFAAHFIVWLNIALGAYEYIVHHRLVPITVGKAILAGDWRSTALLGHPLTAAGVVAVYIMALALRPRAPSAPSGIAILLAIASLMMFGGRTALVSVIVVFAGIAAVTSLRLMRGGRFALLDVIFVTAGVMLLVVVLPFVFSSGVFDNMLTRFASDSGSAQTRIASLHLLTSLDWHELLWGTPAVRGSSLQSMMGLDYGIENFWIAFTVQFGAVVTLLMTIGLGCFFYELLRRSAPGAWVGILFIVITAASSVSFSSKNITLALFVTLITLLLPRAQAAHRLRPAAPVRQGFDVSPPLAPR